MGKVKVESMGLSEFLAFLQGRKVAPYKGECLWGVKETQSFVNGFMDKDSSHSLGLFVFNGEYLVDGLSRAITISLILKSLGLGAPTIEKKWSKDEIFRLKENYEAVRRCVSFFERDAFLSSFLNGSSVTVLTVDDLYDAFCFFSVSTERGKALEPTDLLKAYHLCSMRKGSEEEKLSVVSRWESIGKERLLSLFKLWHPIRHWAKNETVPPFSSEDVGVFEGVEEDCGYPFAQAVKSSPFSLTDEIINGKRFFEMCFHYISLQDELNALVGEALPGTLGRVRFDIPSESCAYDSFLSLSLLMADRFGMESLPKALPVIFKFSFAPRLEDNSLSRERMDRHVLSEGSIFFVVKNALSPYDVYSYPLKDRLSGMRNVVMRKKGPVRNIDFDRDFAFWLGEGR